MRLLFLFSLCLLFHAFNFLNIDKAASTTPAAPACLRFIITVAESYIIISAHFLKMHIFYSLLIFALIGTFCAADEHSNDLEVERVKRVAVEDVEFASADERPARLRQSSSRTRAKDNDAPAPAVKNSAAIILPPYHDSNLATFDKTTQCLLYLEGITIVVIKKKSIADVQHAFALPMNFTGDSYGWSQNYVNCPNSTAADKPFATGTPFSFIIDYQVGTAGHELKNNDQVVMSIKKGFMLTLNFVSNTGFDLVSANISGLSITGADFLSKGANIKNSGATNAKTINMRAYYGYNYACSGTPALLFTPDDNTEVLVGIVLNNFQVQGYDKIEINKIKQNRQRLLC
uniref:Uncharacterized protein n=1 Tax=Panagrolaimus sp. PS1159 TaxID=55785 RepID=A0AC35FFV3_9BILA